MPRSAADRVLADAPVASFFGLRFLERGAEEARVVLAPRREFLQVEDRIHGGVIATLADSAAVHLLYPQRPAGGFLTSIEFKLNFVNPALLDRGELLAVARKVKIGRRVALCDVEVFQDGRTVARGLFTYLMAPPPAAEP